MHDTLEQLGWDALIADAQKVNGAGAVGEQDRPGGLPGAGGAFAPLLVPAIWLPDPRVRSGREQRRFRLHLVKHKSTLKHRIHSPLLSFGHPCPVSDLFGLQGRKLLDRLEIPAPWRETLDGSLYLIDAIERELCASGAHHSYVPLLLTVRGDWHMLTHNQPFDPAAAAGGARPLAA